MSPYIGATMSTEAQFTSIKDFEKIIQIRDNFECIFNMVANYW